MCVVFRPEVAKDIIINDMKGHQQTINHNIGVVYLFVEVFLSFSLVTQFKNVVIQN